MNEIVPASVAMQSFIERAAIDPNFDVLKFAELLRLRRDEQHDHARLMFNAAMSQAQAEMMPVVRDAENNHLRNKYAKLETIDAAIRPIYTHHGFSVRYGSAPSPTEGCIRITCTVAHAGGYFEEQYLDAPLGATGAQGNRTATTPVQAVGSAITYLRRYLLAMVFNVVLADEDDDGEGARRQAAAAATPRPQRVYEPEPREGAAAIDAAAQKALDGWIVVFGNAQTTEAVRKLETGMRYQAAMDNAPPAIVEALRAMCARAYIRVQPQPKAEPAAAPPVENAPENAPELAAAGAGADDGWPS